MYIYNYYFLLIFPDIPTPGMYENGLPCGVLGSISHSET